MPYAFRCRNCNTLAEAEHAGERAVPAKCSTCGAGVHFSPDGIKTYDEDNWLVLAEAEPHELAQVLRYHAISEDEIVAHVPTPPDDPNHVPVSIEVSGEGSTVAAGDATGSR